MTSLSKGDDVDTVILGCPFASLWEIQQIAERLAGRRIADLFKQKGAHTTGSPDRIFVSIACHRGGPLRL